MAEGGWIGDPSAPVDDEVRMRAGPDGHVYLHCGRHYALVRCAVLLADMQTLVWHVDLYKRGGRPELAGTKRFDSEDAAHEAARAVLQKLARRRR